MISDDSNSLKEKVLHRYCLAKDWKTKRTTMDLLSMLCDHEKACQVWIQCPRVEKQVPWGYHMTLVAPKSYTRVMTARVHRSRNVLEMSQFLDALCVLKSATILVRLPAGYALEALHTHTRKREFWRSDENTRENCMISR